MRESLMTGHGDTVVLGIRIRLLLVWTLEAYHYRFRYLFLFLSFVLRLFSFLSAPLPRLASTTHKTRTVFVLLSTDSSKGNTVCALEKELESKDRSSGGRSKIWRVTKGKSGSKARKGTGIPKVKHVGDELSERECLEQVAHVGIALSNKLEAVGELVQTEKTAIRLDISEISEKCEVRLNPRFSSIFAEDHPAERLSSSFPPAGSASGSMHEKDRR